MIMTETIRSSVIQVHQDNYSSLKRSYITDMECIALSFLHYIYPCCRAQRKCLRYRPRGLVYINTPDRTCLHELFIEYKASHSLGSPVFLSTNWRQIITYYPPPSALDGSMGRRTSRRHYSLVNFKSPVGRNHWPSC